MGEYAPARHFADLPVPPAARLGVTRMQWAFALADSLTGDHITPAQDNTELVRALLCWACLESGSDPDHTPARFNPLNDEKAMGPDDTRFNSAGVRNYASLAAGVAAVHSTIASPIYHDLWIACRHGDVDTIRAAVSHSPWSGLEPGQYRLPAWSAAVRRSSRLLVSGGRQGGG